MNDHRYRAFGLTLSSAIPLPELIRVAPDENPDVVITVGTIGEGIAHPAGHGVWWKTAPGTFEIKVPGAARLIARDGREIIIEPEPDADLLAIRTYLLGSVLGAILHQRKLLPLHASAFVWRDSAVLIGGNSGAGKSTVLKGFQARGHAAMSDDTTPVSLPAASPPIAWAAFPSTRLCADATSHFDALLPATPESVHAGVKQVFSISHFDATPRDIAHIILLKTHALRQISRESLTGLAALNALAGITYRRYFLQGMGLRESHFHLVARLTAQVRITLVYHPSTLAALPSLLDEITSCIEEPSRHV